MTLYQVTAYSYDSLLYSLILALFAYWLKITHRLIPLCWKHLIGNWLLLTATLLVKPGYWPVLGLSFLIPLRPAGLQTKVYLTSLTLLSCLTLVAVRLSLPQLAEIADVPQGVSVQGQMTYLVQNPLVIGPLLTATVQAHADTYVVGLIGLFEWLEYGLPSWVYWFLTSFLGYWFARFELRRTYQLSGKKILYLTCLLVTAITGVFLSLYLVWTPVRAGVFSGAQGMHFYH